MTAETVEQDQQDTQPEAMPDLDVIVPDPESLEVEGIPAQVRRLRTREFLALMRCITRGLGGGLTAVRLNTDDPDELQGQVMALLMLAIPNAIDEFGAFLLAIVDPKNADDEKALRTAMANPEIDVLMNVLGIVVEQEKDDLVVLAGKARAWMAKIQQTMKQAPTTGG